MHIDILREIGKETLTTPVFNIPFLPSHKSGYGTSMLGKKTFITSSTMNITVEKELIEKVAPKVIDDGQLIKKRISESRNSQLSIGSDPEFLLDGAKRYTPAFLFVQDSNDLSKPMGLDGYNHVGEFRPAHGTPETHYANLKKCILLLKNVPLRAIAGSGAKQNRPIGGHLHFNIPPYLNVIIALDEYLGKPQLKYSPRNISGRFGRPLDIQPKPWGFEYRSLPSWICHPDLAYLVLVAAYCVVDTARKDELFVPTERNFHERVIEEHHHYKDVLEMYWENVFKKPWTDYSSNDLLACWNS